mgnify:CR=1 FL=1
MCCSDYMLVKRSKCSMGLPVESSLLLPCSWTTQCSVGSEVEWTQVELQVATFFLANCQAIQWIGLLKTDEHGKQMITDGERCWNHPPNYQSFTNPIQSLWLFHQSNARWLGDFPESCGRQWLRHRYACCKDSKHRPLQRCSKSPSNFG